MQGAGLVGLQRCGDTRKACRRVVHQGREILLRGNRVPVLQHHGHRQAQGVPGCSQRGLQHIHQVGQGLGGTQAERL